MKKDYKMLRSPLGGWLGGKFQLRKKIIERFPDDYETYCEAFGGAGWVLLALEKRKNVTEAFNDLNSQLMTFWDVVKIAPRELVAELQYEIVSRKRFSQYLHELKNKKLSNIKHAARFYYVLKCSFGGQLDNFGYAKKGKPRLNIREFDQVIDAAHDRLENVYIENLDFRVFIPKYDWEKALFYLDPPYRKPSSKAYCSDLSDDDYIALRDILVNMKGRFVLSINDDVFIRKLFSDFCIEELPVTYSVKCSGSVRDRELLIMNY